MTSEPNEEQDVPWAMQLVVHRDKAHPAREVDVAEAAASAVVTLLADERSAPGGPWHEAVRTWRAQAAALAMHQLLRGLGIPRWATWLVAAIVFVGLFSRAVGGWREAS